MATAYGRYGSATGRWRAKRSQARCWFPSYSAMVVVVAERASAVGPLAAQRADQSTRAARRHPWPGGDPRDRRNRRGGRARRTAASISAAPVRALSRRAGCRSHRAQRRVWRSATTCRAGMRSSRRGCSAPSGRCCICGAAAASHQSSATPGSTRSRSCASRSSERDPCRCDLSLDDHDLGAIPQVAQPLSDR